MTAPDGEPPAVCAAPPEPSRLATALVVSLPMIVQAVIVKLFAVNMLVWDEFHYASLLHQIGAGEPWSGWLWQQHNEHRIVWTKLVLLAHASLSGWNPVVEMYVSALLTGVISLGLWRLYRATGGVQPLLFLPVALLLCTLASYMNILYGFMTCHHFTAAGMIWAIVLLSRRTRASAAVAAALAFAAMISTLNAIVIWPVGLVVLALTRQPRTRWLAWIVAALVSGLIYFHQYHAPPHHSSPPWSSARVIAAGSSGLACLGSPLAATSYGWAQALGVLTLLTLAATWRVVVARREQERHAGPIALVLIAFGCVAATAIGRGGDVMASKYVPYSTLALIGAWISLVGLRDHRWRRPSLAAGALVLGVGLLAANVAGFHSVQAWRKDRLRMRYLLQTVDLQPDDALAGIFHRSVREIAAYLRAANLGPFREPVDALVPPRLRDRAPTAEVTPGAPIHVELLCPVDTLRDLALAFTPGSLPAAGTLHVVLKDAGAVVAESVTDATQVRELTWITVVLDEPLLGCRERQLTLEVWSPDATSGAALHAWHYPVYYAGVTKQGGRVLELRGLGLAFNAVSAELLP